MNTRTTIFLSFVIVAAAGCSRRIQEPAPMTTGSRLTYEVSEQAAGTSKSYPLTLLFTQTDDAFAVRIQGPKGTTTKRTDLAGEPLEKEFAFDMQGQGTLDLGMLFLPTRDRAGGKLTKGGRVIKKTRFEKWEAWEVLVDTAKVAGNRYYDAQLGVLVGWNVDFGQKAVVGRLVDSQ